jgi:hypothetical protein
MTMSTSCRECESIELEYRMACLEYWANARGKSGTHGRCSGDLLEALKMTSFALRNFRVRR